MQPVQSRRSLEAEEVQKQSTAVWAVASVRFESSNKLMQPCLMRRGGGELGARLGGAEGTEGRTFIAVHDFNHGSAG
jgi:hypothetical protein